jgi:hypothetical protein
MIYITKCSIGLSFVSRYSQMFNAVSPCHAADVPPVSDFVPNPMNHARTYGRNRFCYVSVILPNLQKELEQKLCVSRIPTHRKVQGC